MNWINLRTEFLRSPLIVQSEPLALATWLKVLTYCCEQENNGFLRDAGKWTDRVWLTVCGVTKDEVESAVDLIVPDGHGNLTIMFYPSVKQAEVQAKREAGRKGGNSKAANSDPSSATNTVATEGEGEGNKKGKGKRTINRRNDFDKFWDSYPRKEDKQKAKEAFQKIDSTVPLDLLLSALAWQKQSPQWQKDGGQFIPLPTTWLNKRRWENEAPKVNGHKFPAEDYARQQSVAEAFEAEQREAEELLLNRLNRREE